MCQLQKDPQLVLFLCSCVCCSLKCQCLNRNETFKPWRTFLPLKYLPHRFKNLARSVEDRVRLIHLLRYSRITLSVSKVATINGALGFKHTFWPEHHVLALSAYINLKGFRKMHPGEIGEAMAQRKTILFKNGDHITPILPPQRLSHAIEWPLSRRHIWRTSEKCSRVFPAKWLFHCDHPVIWSPFAVCHCLCNSFFSLFLLCIMIQRFRSSFLKWSTFCLSSFFGPSGTRNQGEFIPLLSFLISM